jgi:nitrite reductase/ring-hydroxylating ferredoxin subunit
MWHKVAQINEISPGAMKQVKIDGSSILLANVDGKFFAIGDVCTHAECDLSTGFMDGSAVYCPCHGSQFDVTTGAVLSPPATESEPTYKVKVEGADIFIEITN